VFEFGFESEEWEGEMAGEGSEGLGYLGWFGNLDFEEQGGQEDP
jgi:hypothetical protein